MTLATGERPLPSPPPEAPTRARLAWGILGLALLLAAGHLLRTHLDLQELAVRTREAGGLGLALLGLLYLPAALAGLPALVLTFAAGWLFGPLPAFLVALPASTLSACAAFGVGRLLAGDPGWLARGQGRVARLARQLDRRAGFWALVALRLSPVTPFSVLNIAFGATPVRLSTYALATLVGSIPSCLGFAIAGALLGPGR